MNLSITDPAFLFPGISLLFLAYTNRYLALANVVRTLTTIVGEHRDENREAQIRSLHLRIILIKYMQAFGVLAFIFCIFAMLALVYEMQTLGELLFISSLSVMVISLLLAFVEIMQSGKSLKYELDRTGTGKRP